jgi:hypothetical protein
MESLLFDMINKKLDLLSLKGEQQSENILDELQIIKKQLNEKTESPYALIFDNTYDKIEVYLSQNIKPPLEEISQRTSEIQRQLETLNQTLQTQYQGLDNIKDEVSLSPEVTYQYLDWIIYQHNKLHLHSIPEASVFPYVDLEKVYVALKVDLTDNYELINENYLLEEEVAQLAIEQTGKYDQSTRDKIRATIFRNKPIPKAWQNSFSTNDDFINENIITLAEAFQNERRLVILGDPGSGKTTVARWLALQLAKSFKEAVLKQVEEARVTVEEHQVDPSKVDSGSVIDLGPVRFPIIIRISDYAEVYAKEKISIFDYLGKHTWDKQKIQGAEGPMEEKIAHQLLKKHLVENKAVVILDGMDEVTANRTEIVREIENFIEVWVDRKVYESLSSIEEENLLVQNTSPKEIGGNQIIITSRIVGYHSSKINAGLTRVFIEPMKRPAVEHFCKVWTDAVFSQIYDQKMTRSELDNYITKESDGLIAAIYDDRKPRIRELASNPLLVTILALVYRNNNGVLPEQRARLYHLALERLYQNWRNGPLSVNQLAYVLSPLAYEMHQSFGSGMIEENELKVIVKKHLAAYHNLDDPNSPPPNFDTITESFLQEIPENVGILSCRATKLYGFLHLTFQEYLTALFLVRDQESSAQNIIDKIDHPRWKEPILLAIGYKSVSSGTQEFNDFLEKIIEVDKTLGDFFPVGTFLLIRALSEMDTSKLQDRILRIIIEKVVFIYSKKDDLEKFPQVRSNLEKAIQSLKNAVQLKERTQNLIISILDQEKNGDRIMAIFTLLWRHNWVWKELVQKAYDLKRYDHPEWDFVLDRLLQRVLSDVVDPGKAPSPKPVPKIEELDSLDRYFELNRNYSLAAEFFGKYQTGKTEDLEPIYNKNLRIRRRLARVGDQLEESLNFKVKALLVSLFGGLGDRGVADHLNRGNLLKYFVSKSADERAEMIRTNPQFAVFFQAVVEKEDLLDIAPDVDAVLNVLRETEYYISNDGMINDSFENLASIDDFKYPIEENKQQVYDRLQLIKQRYQFLKSSDHEISFKPENLYKRSPLSSPILESLREKRQFDIADLKDKVFSFYRQADAQGKIDALVALWSLGENILLLLSQDELNEVKEGLIKKLKEIIQSLRDSLFRSKESVESLLTTNLNKTLPRSIWWTLFRWTSDLYLKNCGIHLKQGWAYAAEDDNLRNPLLYVNTLARLFDEADPDKTYSLAVSLDTIPKKGYKDYEKAFLYVYQAPSIVQNDIGAYSWSADPVPIKPFDQDIPIEVYENLLNLPLEKEIEHVYVNGLINIVLIAFSEQILKNPDLLPEFQIQCILNGALEAYFRVTSKVNKDFNLRSYKGYLAFNIEKMKGQIKDPYHLAKLYLSLLQLSVFNKEELLEEAYRAIQGVSVPEKKAYLLQYLTKFNKLSDQAKILPELEKTIKSIVNPEYRTRLLLKSVLLFPEDRQHELVQEALRSLPLLESESDKSELIRYANRFSRGETETIKILKKAASSIDDSILRSFSLNELGSYLLSNPGLFDQTLGDEFLPVFLTGAAQELIHKIEEKNGQNSIWKDLLLEEGKEKALNQILTAGLREGVQITRDIAETISGLIKKKDFQLLSILWPVLQHPTFNSIPVVESWMAELETAPQMLKDLSRFFIAEQSRNMTLQNVKAACNLYKSDIPIRLKHRISIFFNGGLEKIKINERIFRLSQLDLEIFDYLKDENTLRSKMTLTILYDDPSKFIQWIQRFNEGDSAYSYFLENIFEMTEEFWETFQEEYQQANPELKAHLFFSLIQLSYPENLQKFKPENIIQLVKETSKEDIENRFFMKDHCNAFKRVIADLGDPGEYPFHDAIDKANDLLQKEQISIHEILDMEEAEMEATIQDIPNSIYHYEGSFYKNQQDSKNAICIDQEKTVQFLVAWLEDTLEMGVQNNPRNNTSLTAMLEFLAINAEHSPTSFWRYVDQSALPELLCETVKEHNHGVGCVSAIRMLSLCPSPNYSIINTLFAALGYGSTVEKEARKALLKIQQASEALLLSLIEHLDDKDSSIVYATIKILSNIGQNESTTPSTRKIILDEFIQRYRDLRFYEGVYEWGGWGNEYSPLKSVYVTQLNKAISEAIFDVAGVN